MKSILSLLVLFLGICIRLSAQNSQAAQVNIYLQGVDSAKVGDEIQLVIEVSPKAGWHVYSALASEEGAYRPAEVGWEIESRGFEAVGKISEEGKRIDKMDEMMGGMTRYYKEVVVFKLPVKVTESEFVVVGYFDYMACNEYQCIPFTADFSLKAKVKE